MKNTKKYLIALAFIFATGILSLSAQTDNKNSTQPVQGTSGTQGTAPDRQGMGTNSQGTMQNSTATPTSPDSSRARVNQKGNSSATDSTMKKRTNRTEKTTRDSLK